MQTSEVQIKNLKRGENKNTTMLVVLVSLKFSYSFSSFFKVAIIDIRSI